MLKRRLPRPRLKMATLQMSSRVEGVDLPNLWLYQLAIHLTVIADWLRCDSTSIWLDIESSQSKCPLFNFLKRSVKSKNSPTILLSYVLSRPGLSVLWRVGPIWHPPWLLLWMALISCLDVWTGVLWSGLIWGWLTWVICLEAGPFFPFSSSNNVLAFKMWNSLDTCHWGTL